MRHLIFLNLIALVGCAAPQNTLDFRQPFGASFAPISQLTDEFEDNADWVFYEHAGEHKARHYNLTYRCEGRAAEYFEFVENDSDNPPTVVSSTKSLIQKRYDDSRLPQRLLKTFSDRTNASSEDAIVTARGEKRLSWPTSGIADYIEFDDGWLIALDVGEFGGGLLWLPFDGDSYFISTKNTSDLLKVSDTEVWTAQGLNHLSMRQGHITLATREHRGIIRKDGDGTLTIDPNKRWLAFREQHAAGSDVIKLAVHDTFLVGLTDYGVILVGQNGINRYHSPYSGSSLNAVQNAQDIFVDNEGKIYVAGVDMLGVYENPLVSLQPKLYARKDCKFDFGLEPDESSRDL